MRSSCDILIVGAGPIGLELAAALKHDGADVLHVDAGQIGHTIGWYAPGTRFFSSPERIAIAGVPLVTAGQEKATREEYLAYLRQVAGNFDLHVRTFERVETIRRDGGEFAVGSGSASGEHQIRARRVVLAIGDMHAPRRLEIPGEDLPHVSHYLADPHIYFKRRVLIVGGRNSAVEAAIRLHRVGALVTLCHRRGELESDRIKYWLLPELKWLIDKKHIEYMPGTAPVEITGGEVRLQSSAAGGSLRRVQADTVLLLTGYVQDPSLFRRAGISLSGPEQRPVHNPRTMETDVPGVYVIGTASAGTQTRFAAFIETSHVHVDRVRRALANQPPPPDQHGGPEEALET